MKHVLQADGIQLEFNGRKILSDIYLKCETGKITGLLGRNGEGKSCLMQIIYGALKSGKSVRVDDLSLMTEFRLPKIMRYLPQFNFIPKSLSLKRVFDDYELNLQEFQMRFSEFRNRSREKIRRFSGGEHRLIALYLTVKAETHFALLDEPFTHLNPLQIEKVRDLLIAEKKNKGILITDHMYKNVVEISDSLYVLSRGKTHLTKDLSDIEALGYVNRF